MLDDYLGRSNVIELNITDISFDIPEQVFEYMIETPSALPSWNTSGYDELKMRYSDLKALYAALRHSQQATTSQQRRYGVFVLMACERSFASYV